MEIKGALSSLFEVQYSPISCKSTLTKGVPPHRLNHAANTAKSVVLKLNYSDTEFR